MILSLLQSTNCCTEIGGGNSPVTFQRQDSITLAVACAAQLLQRPWFFTGVVAPRAIQSTPESPDGGVETLNIFTTGADLLLSVDENAAFGPTPLTIGSS